VLAAALGLLAVVTVSGAARLSPLACAAVGEPDRARAEGRRALAVYASCVAARELKRLGQTLAAA
jgi:hypothetical protein